LVLEIFAYAKAFLLPQGQNVAAAKRESYLGIWNNGSFKTIDLLESKKFRDF